jgi:hypothetical protein
VDEAVDDRGKGVFVVVGAPLPAALGVVRNLPACLAAAALDPVIAFAQAGLDLQEDLEHGGIGLGDVFALPR